MMTDENDQDEVKRTTAKLKLNRQRKKGGGWMWEEVWDVQDGEKKGPIQFSTRFIKFSIQPG